MLGRSAGRLEVGGRRQVDGFGLGWLGWVGGRQQAAAAAAVFVFISSFFTSQSPAAVAAMAAGRDERRGNEYVFFLPVGSRDLCVCVVKKRKPSFSHQFGECLVFLVCLFFPPGKGGAGVRELGGEKGVLEVWILEGSFLSSLPPSPNSLTLRLGPTSVCRSTRVSPCTLSSELGGYRFRAG